MDPPGRGSKQDLISKLAALGRGEGVKRGEIGRRTWGIWKVELSEGQRGRAN